MEVLFKVISSDYFWGMASGLCLSFFGAWLLAKFSLELNRKNQIKTTKLFFLDTIKNIKDIVSQMDSVKEASKIIHPDFLDLLDVEIAVYGRNREHLILLDDDLRGSVRKFINDVAIKKAQIQQHLQEFYRIKHNEESIRAEGVAPPMSVGFSDKAFKEAQSTVDKLVSIVRSSDDLIRKLSV